MKVMKGCGEILQQKNGVTTRPINHDNNVVLAIFVLQHPHHSSGELETDECKLLRKEDNTIFFLCTVCQL